MLGKTSLKEWSGIGTAAQGGGGVTIPGGVQEQWGRPPPPGQYVPLPPHSS